MSRLRRVLCPVDLRQPWHAALGFAATLAEEFQSVLDTVYVAEGQDSRTTRLFAPRVSAVEKLMTSHNLTQDLITLVGARAPSVTSTAEVRWGQPLRVVLADASRRRADLIVVGGPDRPLAWRCTARFTDTLAADAPCPVLSVPGRHPPGTPSRILLGVDFSEATAPAVEWTALLARHFNSNVEVLHAERGLVSTPSELGEIEGRFGRSGVRATMRAAPGASLLADLVGRITDDPFELVVVGVEPAGTARLDTSFVERLRRLVCTPVLSIVARPEARPVRSRDPLAGLRELLPSTLESVAQPALA
ncbi:MAG TPA: universal stress protein [Polyangiaceae bacterium]